MKLNNKGFAITAVLYGLLILFVLLVSSYLLVLSARKNRVDNLVNDIEKNYFLSSEESEVQKYKVTINTYLDSDFRSSIIEYTDAENKVDKILISPYISRTSYSKVECDDVNINFNGSYTEFDNDNEYDILYLTINNISSDINCIVYFVAD